MALTKCSLFLLVSLLISSAYARHDDENRVTDYSAYTLNKSDIRLGVYRLSYGITDDIEIGTMNLFWILRIKNFNAKWHFWNKGNFDASVMSGLYWGNPHDLTSNMPNMPFSAFPLYLMGSWRTKSWTLSSGFGYTSLKTDTNQDVGQGSYSTDIAAALSGSTLVFLPSAEWRWGRTTALVLEGRFLMAQKLNGSGTTITQLDEDTTFEMHASGGGDFTVKGLRSFSAGAFWSWDNINLRLGWTFGHLMIPTINAFADTKVQYPDFDLFIRF